MSPGLVSELASDLVGAAILSGAFLGLLAAAELWRRFGSPEAEWTRKLVHLGGGGACLFFPFLVERLWIVFLLALGMTAIFAAGAHFGFLRSLHGVGRRTRGAEYYPLAIFLLLVITHGRPWLYVASVLVLAVADAFAALVGSRYGTHFYEVDDSKKTVEGSLVFFVIAFLAVHLPTLLMTDLPRAICVLAAVQVAVLVTFFEAISLKGADNLFVPLAVAVVLWKTTRQPLSEMVYQNLSLLGLCVLIALLVRRLPYFNAGSTMALILYAYGAWSLGSWHWALPALGGLALYLLIWGSLGRGRKIRQIRVGTVVQALLAPFLFVALANGLRADGAFFGAYLAAGATVLALALVDPVSQLEAWRAFPRPLLAAALAGLAVVAAVLPAWGVKAEVGLWVLGGFTLLAATAVALVLHLEKDRRGPNATGWTAPRFLAGWAVGFAVYALELASLLPAWEPIP